MNARQWILMILGVWLIVSPMLLGFSNLNLPMWNNIIVGALLIIASLKDFLDKRAE